MPLDSGLIQNLLLPLNPAPSVDFAAQGIFHTVLDITPTNPPLYACERIDTSQAGVDAAAYVATLSQTVLAGAGRSAALFALHLLPNPPPPPTPFDIELEADEDLKQQWIVVQLASDVPWCFTPETCGVTSKQDLGGALFDSHWVDAAGVSHAGPIPAGVETCRILWFGLAQLDIAQDHKINFHVTAIQGGMRLPIVFDPDIRNDGGSRIP